MGLCSSKPATVQYEFDKKQVAVPYKRIITLQTACRVILARNRLRARRVIKEICLETYFPQTDIPLLDREEYSKILEQEEQGKIKWD